MGTWGIEPWDNDEAADWFQALFQVTKLGERVEECLQRPLTGNMAEIRAAAYVVLALGRAYIWPLESLDRCLPMAIARLQEIETLISDSESEEYRDILQAIVAEIQELLNRHGNEGGE